MVCDPVPPFIGDSWYIENSCSGSQRKGTYDWNFQAVNKFHHMSIQTYCQEEVSHRSYGDILNWLKGKFKHRRREAIPRRKCKLTTKSVPALQTKIFLGSQVATHRISSSFNWKLVRKRNKISKEARKNFPTRQKNKVEIDLLLQAGEEMSEKGCSNLEKTSTFEEEVLLLKLQLHQGDPQYISSWFYQKGVRKKTGNSKHTTIIELLMLEEIHTHLKREGLAIEQQSYHQLYHVIAQPTSLLFYWKKVRKKIRRDVRNCPTHIIDLLLLDMKEVNEQNLEESPFRRETNIDKHHSERAFIQGEEVTLKLHRNRQSSDGGRKVNLSPAYHEVMMKVYGTYRQEPGETFSNVVGSLYYAAQEVLCKHYGSEVDVGSARLITGVKKKIKNRKVEATLQRKGKSVVTNIPEFPMQIFLLSPEPPFSIPYDPSVAFLLRDRAPSIQQLHLQLTRSRNRMTTHKSKTEKTFLVGDTVPLHLQSYRKLTVDRRINNKLSQRFLGPFRITEETGEASYILDLPPHDQIHVVFHVSQLQRYHSSDDHLTTSTLLAPLAIIGSQMQKCQGSAGLQLRITWPTKEKIQPTWDWMDNFEASFPHLISSWTRKLKRGVLSPSEMRRSEELKLGFRDLDIGVEEAVETDDNLDAPRLNDQAFNLRRHVIWYLRYRVEIGLVFYRAIPI